MSLTREDVKKIADLARLALSDDELNHFGEQLSAVLGYAARLDELDLIGVPPSIHAVAQINIMRDDAIMPSLPTADALFNAAETVDEQFLIQSVLEE